MDSSLADFRTAPTLVSEKRAGSRSQDATVEKYWIRHLPILLALVVLTHIPLLGIGEPDSALFTTGVHQWVQHGSGALSIYSGRACALYYEFIAAVVQHFHIPLEHCSQVMSALSLLAGMGVVAFGYLLGRSLSNAKAAFRGMLLFALSPGFWWVSAESHPQALSLFFATAAIWFFWRYLQASSTLCFAAAALSFAMALGMKNDAILLAPAFLGVALWQRRDVGRAFQAAFVVLAGVAISMILERMVIGWSFGAVSGAQQAVRIYGRLSNLGAILKGIAPVVCGIGPITIFVLIFGLAVGLRKDPERVRWILLLLLWCLPGYLFFLYIWGNNVRHVLAFGMPLFWFAGKYLRLWVVLGCAALSFLVPGNSNSFLYPSPNLLSSRHLFLAKQAELSRVANDLSGQSSCFVGSYTSDYLVPMLLGKGGQIGAQASADDSSAAVVTMPNGSVVTFKRIDPSAKHVDLSACRSLEYDAAGKKTRPFGGEWHVPAS